MLLRAMVITGTLWIAADAWTQTSSSPQTAKPPCCQCATSSANVSRTQANYVVDEELTLVNHHGKTVRFSDVLNHEGPLLLQFAFTTCSTVCPVLSSTTAKVQSELAGDADRVRFVTVSIDPSYDTPEQLAAYAESLNAGQNWTFLTGDPLAISTLRKSFKAYTPNKSRHEALTFLRRRPSSAWTRITGFVSAKGLTVELRELLEPAASDVSVASDSTAEQVDE